MFSRSMSRLVISLTTAWTRWSAKTVLIAAWCFLKPLSTNSLNFGDGGRFAEPAGAALGLHGDDGQVGLRRRVEGLLDGVGGHGPVVVLDHDLVHPAALGGGRDDLGQPGIVAGETAELDLAGLSSAFQTPP